MIKTLLFVALVCSGVPGLAQRANLVESFREMACALEEAVRRSRAGGGSLIDGEAARTRLLEELLLASETLVDRRGTSVELEANEEILFNQPLILPAEQKSAGNWTFDAHRFEVVPKYLYIFSLRFKGEHTLRIRGIRLFFRDGTFVDHDKWFDLENGNGRAFSRRWFSPPLEVWQEGQPKVAKALAAIEWLGSTQDKDRAARIELLLTVPDPSSRPFLQEIRDLSQLDMGWNQPKPEPEALKNCIAFMKKLAQVLELELILD